MRRQSFLFLHQISLKALSIFMCKFQSNHDRAICYTKFLIFLLWKFYADAFLLIEAQKVEE